MYRMQVGRASIQVKKNGFSDPRTCHPRTSREKTPPNHCGVAFAAGSESFGWVVAEPRREDGAALRPPSPSSRASTPSSSSSSSSSSSLQQQLLSQSSRLLLVLPTASPASKAAHKTRCKKARCVSSWTFRGCRVATPTGCGSARELHNDGNSGSAVGVDETEHGARRGGRAVDMITKEVLEWQNL